ncbi:RNA polymerase sigma factor [Larkinella humicola]|uniref:Sigma-70 family RNA polymerase sigma factor n=1 Tax=Larkinella humicola TaxID=2607654 RepID=A0A5N1JSM7_9BACT|nr:sigma-70 family RNA polymerase sigma factor [Larkinella humicola]KAA9357322.1 sigma-70 family RNA polymerase sigma factor [Larkinella humicola]
MEKEFVSLLNRYPGILYKVCSLYCRDRDDRNDLFQEIVLQLWKAYPTFKNESAVSTWMYRISLNTAISNFRKKSGKPQPVSFSDLDFQIPDFKEDIAEEEISLLYASIEQLSPVEKAVISLYLDDRSYDEMATILGISKSNVGVKLNRIKTKLEKLIKSTTR